MRLPFLQVAMEVVDQSAPDLAVLLDADELRVVGGLVRLFKWALGRCPDDLPPSASDVILGPEAPRLIARAAGHAGDPEAFVSACERCQPALLERTEGGIRVRGLDRYDAAWGKSHPDLWRVWKQAQNGARTEPERNRPETVPEPERNRDGIGAEPARKTHTHTQIEEKKKLTADKASDLFGQEAVADDPRPADMVAAWNEAAAGRIPKARLTDGRKTRLAAWLARHGTFEEWKVLVRRVNASAFLRGEKREFVATLDWVLKPENLAKIVEGNYDDHETTESKVRALVGCDVPDCDLVARDLPVGGHDVCEGHAVRWFKWFLAQGPADGEYLSDRDWQPWLESMGVPRAVA